MENQAVTDNETPRCDTLHGWPLRDGVVRPIDQGLDQQSPKKPDGWIENEV